MYIHSQNKNTIVISDNLTNIYIKYSKVIIGDGKKYNNEIITGLNLPMLIEVCENINTLEIDELLSKIEYSSKDSIKNIKKLFNNKN